MAPDSKEALSYALATWVFVLHVDGVTASEAAIAEGCAAVAAATDEETGNAAGEQLVKSIAELLGGTEPSHVAAFARSLYGDAVDTTLPNIQVSFVPAQRLKVVIEQVGGVCLEYELRIANP